jgi:hypothetical protein
MNRRAFVGGCGGSGEHSCPGHHRRCTAGADGQKNLVLVHGLLVDGSSWSEVIARLSAVSTDHVWFAASIKEVQ